MDLTTSAYILLCCTALFMGISKTGVPGFGLIFVVLAPLAIPAKVSTGYILPFLIFGDIIAVLWWRKAAVWRLIGAVMPAMLTGIVIGYFIMGRVDDAIYGRVLGGVVLFLLLLDELRRFTGTEVKAGNKLIGWSIGLIAGIMTMMANAAGPVVMLYLLAMNVSKEEFVGTGAWIYLFINVFKVPFSMNLGLITMESLKVNFMMLPLVILGSFLGVYIMRRIPTGIFMKLMRVIALIGGAKLLFF
ncbi:sulfite exporter TauE/SafE family protein [Desulfovibrio sp. OttesenSCG-928-O18]|nr:sulfite exporter TauE/SafE family protein [Desulfovibrio sp. OttesenSCG-928-O18]